MISVQYPNGMKLHCPLGSLTWAFRVAGVVDPGALREWPRDLLGDLGKHREVVYDLPMGPVIFRN